MSREDLTGSESLLPIRSGLDGPVWASLGPIRGGLSELDGPVWTSLLLPIRGH